MKKEWFMKLLNNYHDYSSYIRWMICYKNHYCDILKYRPPSLSPSSSPSPSPSPALINYIRIDKDTTFYVLNKSKNDSMLYEELTTTCSRIVIIMENKLSTKIIIFLSNICR